MDTVIDNEIIKKIKKLNIKNNEEYSIYNDESKNNYSHKIKLNKKNIYKNDHDNRINYINNRIKNEICIKTLELLKDDNLMEIYKETISVKKNIEKLKKSLDNESIDEDKQKRIINNFISQLIPPGTKGVIRGNMFNKIVKQHILSLHP